MKPFKLTMLGSNAAIPAYGRLTSAIALQYNNDYILFDACEGVQIRFAEYKIPVNKLKYIFISHLHGDHFYGLPSLLSSFNLNNRTAPIRLFAPKGIKKYLDTTFGITQTQLRYKLDIVEFDDKVSTTLISTAQYIIQTIPLDHRICTCGFLVKEMVSDFNIRKAAIKEYNLNIEEIKELKKGKIPISRSENDFINFVLPKEKARSFAYVTDTAYYEEIIPLVSDVTVLYHETTYMDDLRILAEERKHTTSIQAATIAKKANVGHLITGHYSPRYRYVDALVNEAKNHFQNTVKGYDGF